MRAGLLTDPVTFRKATITKNNTDRKKQIGLIAYQQGQM